MSAGKRWTATVDEHGRLVLPPEAAVMLGLLPGASTQLEVEGDELRVLRPVSHLARVYVEPTSLCNFDCRTCMRNVWDEPLGHMSAETYARVLAGLESVCPRPEVFFGGYGEPLAHPRMIDMVRQAKAAGARVELITNGTLLDDETSAALISLGLDRLWVSLDGATPDSYADVRLGGALPDVVRNLTRLYQLRLTAGTALPRIGVAFVAMKRNLHDLPALIRMGRLFGADRFSISNVLAHTPELRGEVLYERSMYELDGPVSEWFPQLSLPRMDWNGDTSAALLQALSARCALMVARRPVGLGASACPFLQKGSLAVRWDGQVSPCLPLLHAHTSYLGHHPRLSGDYQVGSLESRGLAEIWQDPDYVALRERLQSFDFSPCVYCNSCEMAEKNQEDCFGNTAPACGGCLWAQGIIQCP